MKNAFSELRNKELMKRTAILMLPILMQQMISMGINFFDNIMIGHLGEVQIAAVAQSNQVYNLVFFLGMGIGSGAIVMTSQFWGAKDFKSLKTTTALVLRVSLVINLIFMLLAILFPTIILRIFSSDPDVVVAGIPYLRLLGITFVLTGISSSASYILRSVNTVRIPLVASSVGFVLNLFFNWMFIFGTLGAPAMGITGAAIGTLIARVVEFAIIMGHLFFFDKKIGLRINNIFISAGADIRRNYRKYSVPLIISDTSLGVSLAITSIILGQMGKEITTAQSIVNTMVSMLTIIATAIAGAAAVVVGNTIGEGDLEKAKREGNAYILISFIIGIFLIIPILLLMNPFLGLYSISDTTRNIAYSCMIMNCAFVPFQNLADCTSKGILRGGGDTRFLLFWDTILIWAFSIPIGALGAFVWHWPPVWIYFIVRVQYPAKGLVCFARFCTGKWINVIKIKKPA